MGRQPAKIIERAKIPCAQTELMIVPAIEALVKSVELDKSEDE